MREHFAVIVFSTLVISIVGCRSWGKAKITVNSEPPGARIYDAGGTLVGTAPVSRTWPIELVDETGRWAATQETLDLGTWKAFWNDGYSQSTRVRLNLSGPWSSHVDHYKSYNVTFSRPYQPPKTVHAPASPPQQQQQQQQQQQTVVIPQYPAGQRGQDASPGTVVVTADLENADVFVDGLFVGSAPCNLKLGDGVHIIEVRKQGFDSYKREIRVFAGSEVRLRAQLQP